MLSTESVSDADRKTVLDGVGEAGSTYRTSDLYKWISKIEKGISENQTCLAFFEITKQYLAHTIEANKRSDNLYHATI